MCDNHKIVIEDTYQRLYNNTKNNFDTPRDQSSKRVQVFTTAYIPSLQNKSLEIRSKTKTNNGAYDTIVYFQDVEFVEDSPTSISVKSTDNTDYNLEPIDQGTNVQVTCTCLDFYYRFSVWNDKKNSLYGDAPPPYVKRSKSNRMPVNPTKSAGLCKHLIRLFDHVKREGIIK